jgi:Domain of unknown function (DUF4190)
MNDQIRFSCLSCGQHIECDVTESGRSMLCPSCGANLTVPHVMESTLPPPVLDPDAVSAAAVAPQAAPRTSGLAVASLVCSLLSPLICFCCLAGIVCGHLARRAIRRNPMLTGQGVATAGLIISYTALILLMAFTTFIFKRGAAYFKSEVESTQLLSTNLPDMPSAQSQTFQDSNETDQAQSGSPAQKPSDGSGWTMDVKDAMIPAAPVVGEIHGSNFQLKRALFRNGNLKFISADGQESLTIQALGGSIENRSLEFQTGSADDNHAPKIEISWKDGEENKTATFQDRYAMDLNFDAAKGRRIPGQIYLCLPDDSKSYIAGTFTVVLPKPKSSPQPAQ